MLQLPSTESRASFSCLPLLSQLIHLKTQPIGAIVNKMNTAIPSGNSYRYTRMNPNYNLPLLLIQIPMHFFQAHVSKISSYFTLFYTYTCGINMSCLFNLQCAYSWDPKYYAHAHPSYKNLYNTLTIILFHRLVGLCLDHNTYHWLLSNELSFPMIQKPTTIIIVFPHEKQCR